MDRTHLLAARSRAHDPRDTRATPDEIEAFYAGHGHDLFLHLYRLRRALGALLAGIARGTERKRDFVAAPSSR